MSQETQTSEQLTSSQVCYLMLLQDTAPEEILDLDFFWTPHEEATTSGIASCQTAVSENNLRLSFIEAGGK
jgi:hypothetical protein